MKCIQTRSSFKNLCIFSAFVALVEPKDVKQAIKEPQWIIAMQSELYVFERNKVWDLVERPKDRTIIGTRWVFRKDHKEQRKVSSSRL